MKGSILYLLSFDTKGQLDVNYHFKTIIPYGDFNTIICINSF